MIDPVLTVRYTDSDRFAELRADVLAGLSSTPKWLPPKWFYDAEGSELFERITRLPEYYQTRAEKCVLRRYATEIAELTEIETLVELGSGSSEKTRALLDALRRHGTLKRFVPLDVSESALHAAVRSIAAEYPSLTVHGVVDDFAAGCSLPSDGPRMVAFLGSTIGNFLPEQRKNFLRSIRMALRAGEWLLLGVDLVKNLTRLVSAYDDSAGVTAEFNRNVLRVVNRELGGNFAPNYFRHVARWNPDQEWIEMWLYATSPMRVVLQRPEMTVNVDDGEGIRTEVSTKFRRQRMVSELAETGFELVRWWTDDAGDFGLALSRAAG